VGSSSLLIQNHFDGKVENAEVQYQKEGRIKKNLRGNKWGGSWESIDSTCKNISSPKVSQAGGTGEKVKEKRIRAREKRGARTARWKQGEPSNLRKQMLRGSEKGSKALRGGGEPTEGSPGLCI